MTVSGIYKITNNSTKDFYIGSSVNIANRFSCHKYLLRRQIHFNKHLQASYNKYLESSFTFDILLICEPASLINYEQEVVNLLKPSFNKIFNIVESGIGRKLSEETKLRISKAKKGIKHKNKRPKIVFSLDRKLKCSRKGSNHGCSKLTESQVTEIRFLLKKGELYHKDIAVMYNVSNGTISDIRYHRSWRHLSDYNVYPTTTTLRKRPKNAN